MMACRALINSLPLPWVWRPADFIYDTWISLASIFRQKSVLLPALPASLPGRWSELKVCAFCLDERFHMSSHTIVSLIPICSVMSQVDCVVATVSFGSGSGVGI